MSLARKQQGVVSRTQLVRADMPIHAIDYRVRSGKMRSLYRGVYRAGPLGGPYEREMAAALACGERAVLSHRSAAALWELVPRPPVEYPVDITVHTGFRVPGPSVRVHRIRGLDSSEIGRLKGIPITSPARTLLDLAGQADELELERALAVAIRHLHTNEKELLELLSRHRRRPGSPRLYALLVRPGGPIFTRSEAEKRFLELVRRGRLPPPEVNVRIKGYEVDFLWRGEGMVVEVDGFTYHSSSRAFERDRRRDGVLMAAGFRVVRVTWRQLTEEPEAVLVSLAQALARSGSRW